MELLCGTDRRGLAYPRSGSARCEWTGRRNICHPGSSYRSTPVGSYSSSAAGDEGSCRRSSPPTTCRNQLQRQGLKSECGTRQATSVATRRGWGQTRACAILPRLASSSKGHCHWCKALALHLETRFRHGPTDYQHAEASLPGEAKSIAE